LAENMVATDVMKADFPRVSTAQGMADALEQFSKVNAERLPVVDSLISRRLIGTISKTDIMLHLAGKARSEST